MLGGELHSCDTLISDIDLTETMQVIMIVRLYAMYQQSRKVLILLVVTFLPVSIIDGTFTGRASQNSSAGEHSSWLKNWCHANWQTPVVLILSGSYVCSPSFNGNGVLLIDIISILSIAWEVLALCLAAWIAVKHIRELPQSSARGTLGGCFKVLIKTHVVYFTRWVDDVHMVLFFRWRFELASFVAMSCFQIGYLSPKLSGVCRSDTHLRMRARLIISIEPIFLGDYDLSWLFSSFHPRTTGRDGTTPDPWYSRI